jgi:hypothetical protein
MIILGKGSLTLAQLHPSDQSSDSDHSTCRYSYKMGQNKTKESLIFRDKGSIN